MLPFPCLPLPRKLALLVAAAVTAGSLMAVAAQPANAGISEKCTFDAPPRTTCMQVHFTGNRLHSIRAGVHVAMGFGFDGHFQSTGPGLNRNTPEVLLPRQWRPFGTTYWGSWHRVNRIVNASDEYCGEAWTDIGGWTSEGKACGRFWGWGSKKVFF